ncbi:unnamed protein product [Trichogramma brassicae]|uniref:Potassium channel domain-containing protein n=1 Tax=Trichogramma brassicae TaxID=86971 RepID=A0A6H5I2E0_9HYME|nr:unnamed protein product [Trichogramma brassicae]
MMESSNDEKQQQQQEDPAAARNKPIRVQQAETLAKIKSIAGHGGLLATLMIYCLIGGVVFRILELPAETERIIELKEILLLRRKDLLASFNASRAADLSDWEDAVLRPYEQALQNAARSNFMVEYIPRVSESADDKPYQLVNERWSILQAVFFASTIITTIGYGNLYPTTFFGRLFCVLFPDRHTADADGHRRLRPAVRRRGERDIAQAQGQTAAGPVEEMRAGQRYLQQVARQSQVHALLHGLHSGGSRAHQHHNRARPTPVRQLVEAAAGPQRPAGRRAQKNRRAGRWRHFRPANRSQVRYNDDDDSARGYNTRSFQSRCNRFIFWILQKIIEHVDESETPEKWPDGRTREGQRSRRGHRGDTARPGQWSESQYRPEKSASKRTGSDNHLRMRDDALKPFFAEHPQFIPATGELEVFLEGDSFRHILRSQLEQVEDRQARTYHRLFGFSRELLVVLPIGLFEIRRLDEQFVLGKQFHDRQGVRSAQLVSSRLEALDDGQNARRYFYVYAFFKFNTKVKETLGWENEVRQIGAVIQQYIDGIRQ